MQPDQSTPPKLAIVAGGGNLPGRLIESCNATGRPYLVIALRGQADHTLVESAPHVWLRLGQSGSSEKILRDNDVKEVVFAGWVRRPSVREMVPDLRTARLLLKAAAQGLGDDGLLGLIIAEVEKAGFRVVGAHSILPDLLAPEGPIGRLRPDRHAEADIARGIRVVQGLGELDIGQGCIVQQGIVLGVEAIEGTDALIRRCKDLHRKGAGGVLVKMKKPGQDERIDMPTVGERTIELAAESGLRGIAIEAGGALVLDRAELAAAADRLGLFAVGVRAS